jgi:hypothetical protein
MAETVAELIEVAVDLACPPGGEGDEAELRINAIEQFFDLRIDHRVERASGHRVS